MTSLRITGARVVTMNDAMDVVDADLAIVDGRIVAMGHDVGHAHLPAVHVGGDWILPGFVQAHVHLCQTLFRHHAEDRRLLDWLRERVWPLEGAHDPQTLAISARVGIGELLLSGTTAVLDMGTVHHQDAIFEVARDAGIRGAFGKAMMDAGDTVPASLIETTQASIDDSAALAARWHGADDGRLHYAWAPRFALSCTPDLQREVGRQAAAGGHVIHTHANEQVDEIALVREQTGMSNIAWLEHLGLCGPRSVFAHGVHIDDDELGRLARSRTAICHCPSSNLKLGSGIADVPRLLDAGVRVALGADGAPCNNSLDALVEMRLAHLLQCGTRGPGALPAARVARLATRGGAEALGIDDRVGQIGVGFDADLVRIRRDDFRTGDGDDPYAAIVCAGARDLVRDVWVRGQRLVDDGVLVRDDADELFLLGREALATLRDRAGLA